MGRPFFKSPKDTGRSSAWDRVDDLLPGETILRAGIHSASVRKAKRDVRHDDIRSLGRDQRAASKDRGAEQLHHLD